MPDLTRKETEALPPGQLGYVTKAPAAPGDPFTVTVPGFSEQHFYEIARWQSRGTTLPAFGDEVLVVIDDKEEPWVAAWWPAAGDIPTIPAPSEATKGDILVFDGGDWVRLAVGETDQQLIVRSDGTVKWTTTPEIHVKAWGAKGEGTDDTAAIQDAIDAGGEAGGAIVSFPSGEYKLTKALTKTSAGDLTLRGAGQGATKLIQTADDDGLRVTLPEASTLVHIEGIRLVAGHASSMTAGAAVRVVGNVSLPTVTMRDVFIYSSGECDWKYGVHLTDCVETSLENVRVYGIVGKRVVTGFFITASAQASTVHKLWGCAVYNGAKGLHAESSTSPGVEGIQIYGPDFTNVDYGLYRVNSKAGYGAPQSVIVGGHISASHTNVYLQGVQQTQISSVLLYNSSSNRFIHVKDSGFITITANQFIVTGSGDPDGVFMEAPNAGTGTVTVADNLFVMKSGGAKFCVKTAAEPMNNIRVHDNQCSVVAAGFGSYGELNNSYYLHDNTPIDAADLTETVAPAEEISVAIRRASTLLLSTPGGAVTIKKIVARQPGEELVLKCDSALVTVEHNASILLRGAANVAFATGRILVLKRYNATTWVETSRNF